MRIVLDANVLLAGFGTHGLCEALVTVCLESHELVQPFAHVLAVCRAPVVEFFRDRDVAHLE